MNDLLLLLGIKVQDAFAGFCGGVVNAFLMKRSGVWAVMGSVVVGTLTANYLGESVAKMFNIGSGVGAFSVGLCSMIICQKLIDFGRNWKPGGSNDAASNGKP